MSTPSLHEGCSPAAAQIFQEHDKVLESFRHFRSAVDLRRSQHVLGKLLAGFAATIEKHFASEEALMRSSGYDGVSDHATEHKRLLGQLQSVREEFASGAIHASGMLTLFVEVWTNQHIERHDNRFIGYLNGRPGDGC
ncbi:MAG: hemerythrin family protein [Bryobacteraceae bacterium]|jgi:hemerythrin-like metal-binding protein